MNILKRYLSERGMQASFLAGKIGVPRHTLYNIIKLGHLPTLDVAVAIDKYTKGELSCEHWILDKEQNENKEAEKIQKKRKKNELKLTVSQES